MVFLLELGIIRYSSGVCSETDILYKFAHAFCNLHRSFPNNKLDVSSDSYFLNLYVLRLGDHASYIRLLLLDAFVLLKLVGLSFLYEIVTLLSVLTS